MKLTIKFFSALALVAFAFLAVSPSAQAQDKKMKSPAAEANLNFSNGTAININYHSPAVRERTVWGELVPFDKVWRTGANNATTIKVTKDIMIEGKKLAAGTYSIFTIPSEDMWTVIFNSEAEQWGAGKYDESKDVLRVQVAAEENEDMVENMTFKMKMKNDEGVISLMWEHLIVAISISTKG
jgi:hypothetical protein